MSLIPNYSLYLQPTVSSHSVQFICLQKRLAAGKAHMNSVSWLAYSVSRASRSLGLWPRGLLSANNDTKLVWTFPAASWQVCLLVSHRYVLLWPYSKIRSEHAPNARNQFSNTEPGHFHALVARLGAFRTSECSELIFESGLWRAEISACMLPITCHVWLEWAFNIVDSHKSSIVHIN
jgi:hypothetical protein